MRERSQRLPRIPAERIGLWAALIFAITIVAYLPAIRGGFVWDDDDYVTHNPTLSDADGLRRIWLEVGAVPQYYPLVHTTFWIEHHLWGDQALGYHLVNVLLHALGAVLLGVVLIRLSVPGAWLAAAVFALHPVHVESVAWITERKNVLSGVLYLAALLAYLRFSRFDREAARALAPGEEIPASKAPEGAQSIAVGSPVVEDRDWRSYAVALAFFLLALMSKTVACSLPAAFLLLVWWKRGRVMRRDVLPTLPFFALGIGFGLLTMWMEKHRVGALGKDWDLTFAERFLVAGRALWFYAGKLVWPVKLAFIYPRWSLDPGAWWQYLFPLAAATLAAMLWGLRRRIGRAPLAAALFFAGTLTPALGFFDVYPMRFSFVADHFQYLASLGPVALGAAALAVLNARLAQAPSRGEAGSPAQPTGPSSAATARPTGAAAAGDRRTPSMPAHDGVGRYLWPALCASLAAVLGLLTWNQAHAYTSLETLWRDTLAKNPGSWMPHYNLGQLLDTEGRLDEAISQYREALLLEPGSAEAHMNLGAALDRQGQIADALTHYREALRLKPGWAQAQNDLAWVLATQEDPRFRDGPQAVQLAEQACAATANRQPLFLDTLAAAYAEVGRFDDAARTARSAIELAAASGLAGSAREIQSRLELYEAGRPYHENESSRKAKPLVLERYGIVG